MIPADARQEMFLPAARSSFAPVQPGAIAMKSPGLLVRVAVITSAVVLVSGFIGYQVGAFNGLFGSRPTPPPHSDSPTGAYRDPAFMGSSKYIVLKTPDALSQPAQAVNESP
jgi:hypothetical protein